MKRRILWILFFVWSFVFCSFSYSANQLFLGTGGDEEPRSLILVQDGYVLGGFSSQLNTEGSEGSQLSYKAYIYKINAKFEKEWEYISDKDSPKIYSLIEAPDGGIVAVGSKYAGKKGRDGWVIKLDGKNGTVLWEKSYGGIGNDGFNGIALASYGFLVVGDTQSYGVGGSDLWIIALTDEGNLLWHKTFGQSGVEVASSIAKNGEKYFISGSSFSFDPLDLYRDMLFVEVDENGNLSNKTVFRGIFQDLAALVVPTSDGGILVPGFSDSFTSTLWDAILLKFGQGIEKQWSRFYYNYKSPERVFFRHAVEIENGYLAVGGRHFFDTNAKSWRWEVLIAFIGKDQLIKWVRSYRPPEPYLIALGRNIVQVSDGYVVLAKAWHNQNKNMDNWIFKISSDGVPFDGSIPVSYLNDDFSAVPFNMQALDPNIVSKVFMSKAYKETLQSGSISIKKGWNLLSQLRAQHMYTNDLKGKPIDTMWAWNALKMTWAVRILSISDELSKQYAQNKGFEHLDKIEPGKGFWINASDEFELD